MPLVHDVRIRQIRIGIEALEARAVLKRRRRDDLLRPRSADRVHQILHPHRRRPTG